MAATGEAGFDIFKAAIKEWQVTNPGYNPIDKTSAFIIEMSQRSNYNLVPFFEAWKVPVTAATKSTMSALNLPAFPFNPVTGL